jgi:hypothetical protein
MLARMGSFDSFGLRLTSLRMTVLVGRAGTPVAPIS